MPMRLHDSYWLREELWHIFVDATFPGLHSTYQGLFRETRSWAEEFSFLGPNFIHPFGHFLLNLTAMEAGRKSFAVESCQAQLREAVPDMARLESAHPAIITSVCVGTLFEHVFSFRQHDSTSNVADRNLALIRGGITRVSDATTFRRASQLAEAVLEECQLEDGDIKTDSLVKPITQQWLAFFERYHPDVMEFMNSAPMKPVPARQG